eukprot:49223-Chlamydomonas_euryale.AAC.2
MWPMSPAAYAARPTAAAASRSAACGTLCCGNVLPTARYGPAKMRSCVESSNTSPDGLTNRLACGDPTTHGGHASTTPPRAESMRTYARAPPSPARGPGRCNTLGSCSRNSSRRRYAPTVCGSVSAAVYGRRPDTPAGAAASTTTRSSTAPAPRTVSTSRNACPAPPKSSSTLASHRRTHGARTMASATAPATRAIGSSPPFSPPPAPGASANGSCGSCATTSPDGRISNVVPERSGVAPPGPSLAPPRASPPPRPPAAACSGSSATPGRMLTPAPASNARAPDLRPSTPAVVGAGPSSGTPSCTHRSTSSSPTRPGSTYPSRPLTKDRSRFMVAGLERICVGSGSWVWGRRSLTKDPGRFMGAWLERICARSAARYRCRDGGMGWAVGEARQCRRREDAGSALPAVGTCTRFRRMLHMYALQKEAYPAGDCCRATKHLVHTQAQQQRI